MIKESAPKELVSCGCCFGSLSLLTVLVSFVNEL
jgi:hypothetical protein